MVYGIDLILWLSLALGLFAAYFALRVAVRWRSWELALPVLAVATIATGPALEILGDAQLIDPGLRETLLEYRWAAVAILGIAAMIVVARMIERERRLFAELAITEERFRSISRVMPVGVFQADLDGSCIYANDVALEMLGIQLGDAVGEGWIRRLHPDDRDRVVEEWQRTALEGRDFRSEYRFRSNKNESVWVLGHVLALKDEDGDVVGHVGAITDITGRKRNEIALQQARETLEQRVTERTSELTRANRELEREIENRSRAEAAVAESESRLKAILDNTPAHIFIKDLSGHYLYLNRPRFRPDLPADTQTLVGRTDLELFSPDIAAELRAADRKALDSGEPSESESNIPGEDGERTYLTVRFPLFSADGKPYAVAGVATDITSRARSTEAIQRVFDLSPAGMCSLTPTGEFQLVNRSFASILGRGAEELVGRHFAEFIHPHDLADALGKIEELQRDGSMLVDYENRYRHSSGEYRTISWHVSFSRDANVFYAAAADVTDAARERRAIRQIYQLSPSLMCTFNRDGTIAAVNPVFTRTLGFSEAELIGHHYLEFVHPDDRETARVQQPTDRDAENAVTSYEVRILCKNGSYRILSCDVSASVADGVFYGVARDVTDARQMQDQMANRRDEMAHLVRLQTMGEMASEIAHELNQPLGAIVNYARGAANRMRDHAASEDEILSLLEKIAGQALRGGDLIRKIRTFAKKAEIEVNESDLNKLVRDAVGLVTAGGRSGVPIRLVLAPELPEIQVDGIQIEQVIVNLVRNAVDAVDGREDAELTITTQQIKPHQIRLTVADNGPGLARMDTEKIFEAFFTTKPGGLGLGLPISRSIVQAHGGSLWVENSAGGWTRFHMLLPAAVS